MQRTSNGLEEQEASQPLALVHVLQVVAGDAVKGVACNVHQRVGCLLTELHVERQGTEEKQNAYQKARHYVDKPNGKGLL